MPVKAQGPMMRVLKSGIALTALLAWPAPSYPAYDRSPTTALDGRGRISSVSGSEGLTTYDYFDDDSVKEMRDPGGTRYSFDEGAVPARLATASPNFLPALAATATHPLDLSANRFAFGSFMFER